MYLSRKLTTRSLPEIGRRFGGRDHTTVLHACRRIEALIEEDPLFRQEVDFLSQMLPAPGRALGPRQKARKIASFSGRKTPVLPAFFLPFRPPFGMVLHLSLGAASGRPASAPKHKKIGVFRGTFVDRTAVRKRAFISDGTLPGEAHIRPMKINVERGAFLKALNHVQSVVERRNTIPILSNVMIEAGKGALKLTATDLDIEIVEAIPADILRNGSATAPAHMLYDIVRKLPDGAQVQVELLTSEGGRLAVSAGSVALRAGLPAARRISPRWRRAPCPTASGWRPTISSASSTRRASPSRPKRRAITSTASMCMPPRTPSRRSCAPWRPTAIAWRAIELELPDGAADMPGVIMPRKTVGELRKLLDDADGAIEISLSDTKIQFGFNGVELTSKLIDGNFPPYERVIPSGNDKALALEAKEFAQSVDRVSTICADKTRAVKLNVAKDKVTLSVVNPECGTATEDVGATYSAAALEIGFNARYLLDITGQIEGKEVRFLLSDAGSPAIIEDAEDARTLYVLMPLRV